MPPFSPCINYQDVLIKHVILRTFAVILFMSWQLFLILDLFHSQFGKFECLHQKNNANPSQINKLSNVYYVTRSNFRAASRHRSH